MPEGDLGDVLSAPVTVGITLTNVWTIPLQPGTYKLLSDLHVVHSGTTGFTITPAFTGTATGVNYLALRATAAAIAAAVHTSFATTASSVFIYCLLRGMFTVTVAGNLTVGATRVGGTSSVVQIGSALELYKIG